MSYHVTMRLLRPLIYLGYQGSLHDWTQFIPCNVAAINNKKWLKAQGRFGSDLWWIQGPSGCKLGVLSAYRTLHHCVPLSACMILPFRLHGAVTAALTLCTWEHHMVDLYVSLEWGSFR